MEKLYGELIMCIITAFRKMLNGVSFALSSEENLSCTTYLPTLTGNEYVSKRTKQIGSILTNDHAIPCDLYRKTKKMSKPIILKRHSNFIQEFTYFFSTMKRAKKTSFWMKICVNCT